MPTRQTLVSGWLTEMAAGLKPTMSEKELRERIRIAARELASKYPPEAFTAASRQNARAGLTEFPGADELDQILAEWMKDHGPVSDAQGGLPGSEDPTLTREDQLILQNFERNRADGFPNISAPGFRSKLTIRLGSYRKYYPRVFRYILRTDLEAASIAVQYGWDENPIYQQPERTDEQRAWASVTVDEAVKAMAQQRRPQPTYAADGAGVGRKLDDAVQAVREASAAFEAQHKRKLGELTPEQLAAVRAAAGIKLPAGPPADRRTEHTPTELEDEPWTPPWLAAAE